MLQHLGSYLNPNRVSFKWPWAEMLCCLIDGVISFQGYHFPCLFTAWCCLNTHRQSSTLFTGRTNPVGPKLQRCCIAQAQRNDLHLMGPSRTGWARRPRVPHRAREMQCSMEWDLPPTQRGDWRYLSQVTGLVCHRPLIIWQELELVRFTGPFW